MTAFTVNVLLLAFSSESNFEGQLQLRWTNGSRVWPVYFIIEPSMPSCRMSNILTYQVRVALATSDVHNILEIPATDEIHVEDRNHGLA